MGMKKNFDDGQGSGHENGLGDEVTAAKLELLFNRCFRQSERTVLLSGGDEPLYHPAKHPDALHTIVSTRNYVSSVLHEVSHWCLAGAERRQLVDYGYWYQPDGRSPAQQQEFEAVEVKPQALEWIFSQACGIRFRVSVDNVAQPELRASEHFKEQVVRQAKAYLESGLPSRALIFNTALLSQFGAPATVLSPQEFGLDILC